MLRHLLAAPVDGRGGKEVGRRHVKSLMKQMGIGALYRRPRTTKPELGHKIFPYLPQRRSQSGSLALQSRFSAGRDQGFCAHLRTELLVSVSSLAAHNRSLASCIVQLHMQCVIFDPRFMHCARLMMRTRWPLQHVDHK
jgi:hypothetical protein